MRTERINCVPSKGDSGERPRTREKEDAGSPVTRTGASGMRHTEPLSEQLR